MTRQVERRKLVSDHLDRYHGARLLLEALKVCAAGFAPDPGTSDLGNEQPIYLRITLGDYRRMGHIISKAEAGR